MKKMMKVFTGLLLVFFLFNFVSCKKDKEIHCKLTVLKWIETDGFSTYEEISYFYYDSKGRLEKIQIAVDEYVLFKYGSNGKLEKIEEHYGEEMDYLLFTWDGNTVTRQWYWQDGGTHNPSSYKQVLEYDSKNQILRLNEYYLYTEDYELEEYADFTWAGGNVTKVDFYGGWFSKSLETKTSMRPFRARKAKRLEEEHKLSLKGISPDFEKYMTLTYTYDKKNNPFDMAIGMWELWPIFMSKNNALKEHGIYYPDDEYEETYTYTYNSNNYPNTMTMVYDDWSNTLEFSYDCK